MPQTRFVLKKALEQKLDPIVVVNKIDKPTARPLKLLTKFWNYSLNLEQMTINWNSQLFMHRQCNGTSSMSDDPTEQEDTMA